MTWKKFDSLDAMTWPPEAELVFWKITITGIPVFRGTHLVECITVHEGRPTVWDPFLRTEDKSRPGDYRFLDKDTETVYWMKIPELREEDDIVLSSEVSERIETAVAQAERDIIGEVYGDLLLRKNLDDSFTW